MTVIPFLFSDPLLAIENMRKLLKPSGRLIIAELDNSTWYSYPLNKALQQDIQLLCETGTRKNIDVCIGPKIYGYLRDKHFSNISVKIIQPVLTKEYRHYLTLKFQAWSQAYLNLGLLSSGELEIVNKGLYNLVKDENFLLAGAKMFLTCGEK